MISLRAVRQIVVHLYDALTKGDLIEKTYGLSSLTDMLQEEHLLGAARYLIVPASQVESIFTFKVYDNHIEVHAASSKRSVQDFLTGNPLEGGFKDELPECDDRRFQQDYCRYAHGAVDLSSAPELMSTWQRFSEAAFSLESQDTRPFDGTIFRHKAKDRCSEIDVYWRHMGRGRTPIQVKLVRTYLDCAKAAGLGRFVRKRWYGNL